LYYDIEKDLALLEINDNNSDIVTLSDEESNI
jgi:hypothetical protein